MTNDGTQLLALLEAVERGELDPRAALGRLTLEPYRDLGFARVDTHRELRQGAPEVVYGEGKSSAEARSIMAALIESGASSALLSRADQAMLEAVAQEFPEACIDERAGLAWIEGELPTRRGQITLISAGTSDRRVVREAEVRAQLLGTSVRVHEDVGVAGLHRLDSALEDVVTTDCLVVVAGQDAALISVLGGLTAAPVIGVPTSVGYGAALGGISALLAMLVSCATGVAVVNIDDGIGAGTIAARIARASASTER